MLKAWSNLDLSELSRRATESAAASIRSLSTEEVHHNKDPSNDSASIANSTISSGISLSRQGSTRRSTTVQVRGGFLPSVAEDDTVSVLTHDPYSDYNKPTNDDKLRAKDEELKQLEAAHELVKSRCNTAVEELTQMQIKFRQEHREHELTIEDLQSQKIILQERLDLMEEQLHSEDLAREIQALVEDEAPDCLNEDNDELQASTHSGKKNGFRMPFGQKDRDKKIHAEKDEYIQKLQAKLTEATKNVHIMSNQMSVMEDTLAEQVHKLRMQLKSAEQARIEKEVEYLSRLDEVENDKKEIETSLLAKLEAKEDRVARMEDLLDEVRELAEKKNAGRFSMEDFAAVVALDTLKLQYDHLSREKDEMCDKFHDEIEALQQEVARLQMANEKKQRTIERLKSSDGIAALEQETMGISSHATESSDDNDSEWDAISHETTETLLSSRTEPLAPPAESSAHKRTTIPSPRPTPTRNMSMNTSSPMPISSMTGSMDGSGHSRRGMKRYHSERHVVRTHSPSSVGSRSMDSSDRQELKESLRNLMDSVNKMNDEMDEEKSVDALNDEFERKVIDMRLQQGLGKKEFNSFAFRKQSLQHQGQLLSEMDTQDRKKQEGRLSRFL